MPYAQINGQRIAFEDSGGDGPVVVFSHGFLMAREMFAPQVIALTPEFRVVTWDQRGFGDTEFDEKPFSYWDSAADLIALLDHLGIAQAVLAGMSQGGFVSMRAALLAPERVRGLVLIDTTAAAEDPAKAESYADMLEAWASVGPTDPLAALVAGIIIDHPEHDPHWISIWQSRPRHLIVEPGRTLLDRDGIAHRLTEIGVPALVIHGTEDNAIPMEAAEHLAGALSQCRGLIKVEGAAHASNLTHPDQVNPPLLAFLRGI